MASKKDAVINPKNRANLATNKGCLAKRLPSRPSETRRTNLDNIAVCVEAVGLMDEQEAKQTIEQTQSTSTTISQRRPKLTRSRSAFERLENPSDTRNPTSALTSLDSVFAPRKKRKASVTASANIASLASSSRLQSRISSTYLSKKPSNFQMPKKEKRGNDPLVDPQAPVDPPVSSSKPASPSKKDSSSPRKKKLEKAKTSSSDNVADPALSSTSSQSSRSSTSSASLSSRKGRTTRNSNKPGEDESTTSQVSATDSAAPLDSKSPGNVATESDAASSLPRSTNAPPAQPTLTTPSIRSDLVSGKFVNLLNPLLEKSDPTLQLMSLQELSELLSMATEDMFIGGGSSLMYGFNVEEFVKALVAILKGSSSTNSLGFEDEIPPELLAEMDLFNEGSGIVNSEILLLAGRCLSNLLEANPSSSGQIVQHGGVQILVSKLTEIQFIDLAEQMLQVLEKISADYPGAIFRANGLIAVLQFIDFFNLHVQRTCVTIAANLCHGLNGFTRERLRNTGEEITPQRTFEMVKEAMTILEGLLQNGDPKILEQTVRSISYIVEWVCKSEDKLQTLITSSLLRSIIEVILPAPTKPVASPFVFTQLVKVLATVSRGSADLGVLILSDLGAIEVIRNILTGGIVLRIEPDSNVFDLTNTQVDQDEKISAAVMDVVVNRPAEQVLEVLALACDLLPMLPKEHEIWSLNKQLEFRAARQIEKHISKTELDKDGDVEMGEPEKATKKNKGKEPEISPPTSASASTTPSRLDHSFHQAKKITQQQNEERVREVRRLNLLKAKPALISNYITRLLPILIEVFSASVNPQVRRKVVKCVAKGVWFMIECHEEESMQVDNGNNTETLCGERLGRSLLDTLGFGKLVSELIGTQELAFAPLVARNAFLKSATTVAAITDRDRRDALLLVAGGLQIAKIVQDNCGDVFKIWFLREGVVAEMENIVNAAEISENEKKLALSELKPDNKSEDEDVKYMDDLFSEWKKLKQQTDDINTKEEEPEVVEKRNQLKNLVDHAQELINKVKSTVNPLEKQTEIENSTTDAQKRTSKSDLQIDTGSTEKFSEEKKSPTSSLLTGFKNVIEKLKAKSELPQIASSSSNSIGTTPATSQSLLSTLNGEKMSESDIRKWCVTLCRIMVEDAKAKLNGSIQRDAVSDFVLDDLKQSSIELQTDKSQSSETQTLKPSEKQVLSNIEFKSCDEILKTLQKVAIRFSGSATQARRRSSASEKVTTKENQSDLFSGVTVYELMESGIMDSLISFLTTPATSDFIDPSTMTAAKFQTPLQTRLRCFIHVFMNGPTPHPLHHNFYVHNALRILVQRLQQTLSRIERFQVATAFPAPVASEYGVYSLLSLSSTAMREQANPALQLARQIRIRLVAETPGVGVDGGNTILVSIHAVATFKALQEYLRTRLTEEEIDFEEEVDVEMVAETGGHQERQVEDETRMDDFIEDEDDEDGDEDGDELMNVSDLLIHSEAQLRRQRRNETRQNDPNSANSPHSADSLQGPPNLSNPVAPDAVVDVHTEVPEKESEAGPSANSLVPSNAETSKTETSNSSIDLVSKTSTQPANKGADASTSTNLEVVSNSGASTSKPTNPRRFNLSFKIDGYEFPKEMTIFGAIYKHEQKKHTSTGWEGFGASSPNIWQQTYTITFKKVYTTTDTPARIQTLSENKISNLHVKLPFQTDLPSSITLDHPAGKILYLLRILHGLNSRWSEIYTEGNSIIQEFGAAALAEGGRTLSESNKNQATTIVPLLPTIFQNNKLTSKLNRQLDEPLVLASNAIPKWCEALARNFAFLVPFDTRLVYLQSTSFGYSRSMSRWQQHSTTNHGGGGAAAARGGGSGGRNSTTIESIGRIQRQKVRIARPKLVDSMVRVMELYGSTQALLEVEFFEEVGTGLGPTLEFFASVSKEVRRRKGVLVGGSVVEMWRDDWPSGEYVEGVEEFVGSFMGLFPAPMTSEILESDSGRKCLELFKSLGVFVAKALLDSRMVDLPFNPIFLEMVVGQEEDEEAELEKAYGVSARIAAKLHLIKHVDSTLYTSLLDLNKYVNQLNLIQNSSLSEEEKAEAINNIKVKDASIDDLCLDFTLPGKANIELVANGANIAVTVHNIPEYINAIADLVVGAGVSRQIDAFKRGFNKVFPVTDLRCFSVQELGVLVSGAENEDWSKETIMESIKADHGFNQHSKTITNLVGMMSEFTAVQRREFLSFVTGSPKLPIGGFKALSPPLTVVCKMVANNSTQGEEENSDMNGPDGYLPSVMTCVNYLKVPEYSSLEIMKRRFEVAVREGQGCFHLS
ncbi:Ubiquitin fusion degradation protein 4 [Nowakowskiella sp. JEL0078]|nr:Ubiquitin fusion degradation protein 4 [Nowakowskiella sp. JEL0078]